MALKTSNFSLDCLSLDTHIKLYPFTIAASARPIPVFPEVPSTMVPPGFNFPSFSASSIILIAIRSFTEFPGLKLSTLTNTSDLIDFVIEFNLINGVLPIVSIILLKYFIKNLYFLLEKTLSLKQR